MDNSIRITRATTSDCNTLADLAKTTFLESHGHSASPEDISIYVDSKYTPAILKVELEDPANIYHLLYFEGKPAGFSKIILNSGHEDIPTPDVTKLERIYILREYYSKQLGYRLFGHLAEFSQSRGQAGMWLYVWKENKRAVDFYSKLGFAIIGTFDFRISENHSNPNHRMYLSYE